MISRLFNKDWQVAEKIGSFGMQLETHSKTVSLPYDALLFSERTPDALGSFKTGFYRNGTWEYKKIFHVSEDYEKKKVIFQFDGVFQRAMVYINGDFAGHHPYGYSQFFIEGDRFLRYGSDNEIKVIVRTADDSRWYSGAGIYRDVYMLTADFVYIEPRGLRLTTPNVANNQAVVCAAISIKNDSAASKATIQVETEIMDNQGNIVTNDKSVVTVLKGESAVLRQRMYVSDPKLWSVEEPNLYVCKTKIYDAAENLLDESVEPFGIRSLELDNKSGLSINGKSVKLRGACIHHDNGPIGAVSIAAAEERRITILKEAGFNAIRMSHHPASSALLRACDKLGMLVMEEAFDVWTMNKSDFDYALDFPVWWETDIEAMVSKCYNHPSVIMYSIGNEIPDTGSPNGSVWGRRLAEKIRLLDSTRFTINSINGMVSVMDLLNEMRANAEEKKGEQAQEEINGMMTNLGDTMKAVMVLEVVTKATEESFACVDIAGYNYMDSRYEMDQELFPNRIICGTETFPPDIDLNWRKVLDNNHVIGDFTWTGWDYLGEAGIGQVKYTPSSILEGVYGAYPSLTSMSGDISITGFRRPASYYREIVFGLRKAPYIAVQRPQYYHVSPIVTPWSWSDSVCSWSWLGYEGRPIKVEVYAESQEVELLLNGSSLGRQPTGEKNRFKAVFDTEYHPGELVAVAYTNGVEQERFSLYSAEGELNIRVFAERDQLCFDDADLAFIPIVLTDSEGSIYTTKNCKVQVLVEGPGELSGFGTDDPNTTENFSDSIRTTIDGRALAVIRPIDKGEIKVTVKAEGMQENIVFIKVN
ncbi:glycoside hydrolase family 2 TIM barrel-domain containing protein [Paenibacillus sinopodophylli]|uniref:glycoside hydrolase family 2 TIM barrel-domain containing protein n=1 Tax=Paenibacillus sinopodophylli TaxID=1837342 RepID=UPI00110CA4BF|nr:glycoside hydrolase family 2 TIM barrel-domain containing protein [Paenibacillus sinopodophylli]